METGPGGLHEREAAESPRGRGCGVQRDRATGRVAQQVEGLEAGLIVEPQEARHLRVQAIPRWRCVGRVELEVLGAGIDIVAQLLDEVNLGRTGWQDPTR